MSRYYEYMGRKLPSVTTICGQLDKPALVQWAANSACDYISQELAKGNKDDEIFGNYTTDDIMSIIEKAKKAYRLVSREALDIGSMVHGNIEYYLKTGKEPIMNNDSVISAYLAFLEWADEYKMEPIDTEKTVYADRYAGTCDLICWLTINDKRLKYIVDFKASKGIYPEYRYQIAAYRNTDASIQGSGILRLDKVSGLPEWKDTSKTHEADYYVFSLLVDLWYAMHPRSAKKALIAA